MGPIGAGFCVGARDGGRLGVGGGLVAPALHALLVLVVLGQSQSLWLAVVGRTAGFFGCELVWPSNRPCCVGIGPDATIPAQSLSRLSHARVKLRIKLMLIVGRLIP